MAALVLLGAVPRRFPLGRHVEIGRSPECDVVLTDTTVSRRHARMEARDGRYHFIDLQSRYGSCVNGAAATESETPLRHGDLVTIGQVELQFEDRGGDAAGASGDDASGPRTADGREAPTGPAGAQSQRSLEATVSELEDRVAELTRAERRHQVLLEVGRLTSFNFDPKVLLECAADAVVRATRAERCAVLLVEGGLLLARTLRNLPAGLPPGRWPLAAQALQQGALVEAPADAEGREGACAPMTGRQGQPLGVLYVELPPGRAMERDEADLTLAVAQQIALSLDNAMLLERVRGEERKRATLSRYMSDKVVDAILGGEMSLELGGEHRVVTVMFVDIRGFTPLSERLQPADVLAMLNEYFSATTEAVFAVDGTVDKYIGDALMAVFGAPQGYPDHALRAVKAAHEIRRAVARLREGWAGRPWAPAPGGPTFDVGIGVNSGGVFAGNVGSQRRMEYTVIGDAVNVASRLCSIASRGQVLIGPETYEAVRGHVAARPLAPLKVKGKEQLVQAYELA